MRARKTDRLTLESELRRAIEREEITILYQPIVRLEDRSIAGFEALARWDHPKLGGCRGGIHHHRRGDRPDRRSRHVRAGPDAKQLAIWQRAMRSREPIFASVNVSSRQLLRHDLIHDIRTVLSRSSVARGTLKLETDGIARHGEPGTRRPNADADPRTRHRIVAGRFRHRPFVAGLSAAFPVRHHQDRPVLRPHHQPRHAAGDPEIDHRAGA